LVVGYPGILTNPAFGNWHPWQEWFFNSILIAQLYYEEDEIMNGTSGSNSVTQGNHSQAVSAIVGLVIVLTLAFIAWWTTKQVYILELPLGIPGKIFEYPLWAVLIGLMGNAVLKSVKLHDRIHHGFRTELFLKIGLVLLGAGISFKTVVTAAGGSIIQSVVLVTSVFFFCWWLGGKFRLDDKLRAVMSTAISICGVSAAIAAAGSVMAKKEQVTYITTLVIVTALPLMVIAPLLAVVMHLSQAVAGAWFGGNIDTTAAVVGAGTIYGDTAQKVATIVKSTQNAFIGVAAFLLALYFATVVERKSGERPSAKMIWDRFPKFVLGFIAASLLYTFGVIDGGKGTVLEALKNWAFTLAFVCMGLELSVSELKSMGWSPVSVFLITTVFNTLLALGMAWLIFGIWFPVSP
jgi:uncharacterized membrane protein YadS